MLTLDMKAACAERGIMSETSVISAFSAQHVARVTGLTERQLAYWDRLGFFRPNYSHVGEGVRTVKVYTFQDVVGLRVISVLLRDHKLSLQYLRTVAEKLVSHSNTPWSELTLGVCQGEIVIFDRKENTGVGLSTGQYQMLPIIDQIRHVRRAIDDLSKRQQAQIGAIERHRNIAHNARVFAGTRIPVKAIQQFLDAGYTIDAILREYPSLERKDIEAVLAERNSFKAA
jgi:uncharacterized protein (DUF433 family)